MFPQALAVIAQQCGSGLTTLGGGRALPISTVVPVTGLKPRHAL